MARQFTHFACWQHGTYYGEGGTAGGITVDRNDDDSSYPPDPFGRTDRFVMMAESGPSGSEKTFQFDAITPGVTYPYGGEFWFYIDSDLPETGNIIPFFDACSTSSGNPHWYLAVTSAGSIVLYDADGNQAGTASVGLAADTWYRIGYSCTFGNSATFRLFVDGTQVGNWTSKDLYYTGTTVFACLRGQTGLATYPRDFFFGPCYGVQDMVDYDDLLLAPFEGLAVCMQGTGAIYDEFCPAYNPPYAVDIWATENPSPKPSNNLYYYDGPGSEIGWGCAGELVYTPTRSHRHTQRDGQRCACVGWRRL